jgi:magnesium-transporting ATPase (P-type)
MGSPPEAYPAWVKSTKEVQQHFRSDVSTGLSAEEIESRREKYGYNELSKEPPTPLWRLILDQFDDTLVKASCLFFIEFGHHLESVYNYFHAITI